MDPRANAFPNAVAASAITHMTHSGTYTGWAAMTHGLDGPEIVSVIVPLLSWQVLLRDLDQCR
jgi:hypothetical protein